MWSLFLAAGLALADSGAATGDTGSPPGPDPDTDADEDGWTLGAGDCDDQNPVVNPGQIDVCFDGVDNDCTSLADEECDNRARLGALGGGGGCTGGGNIAGTQTGLLVPFLGMGIAGLRRRRKA